MARLHTLTKVTPKDAAQPKYNVSGHPHLRLIKQEEGGLWCLVDSRRENYFGVPLPGWCLVANPVQREVRDWMDANLPKEDS